MKIRCLVTTAALALVGVPLVTLEACSGSPVEATGGSAGATSTGVGGGIADEAPDYERAFPQDRVARIDITITK